MLKVSYAPTDDYDHGYGHNYNHGYGRGYYADEHGNYHHSGGSAAAAAASSGRRLLGNQYYYGYHNYHDSSAAAAAAAASGGDASAAAAAASSGELLFPSKIHFCMQSIMESVSNAASVLTQALHHSVDMMHGSLRSNVVWQKHMLLLLLCLMHMY